MFQSLVELSSSTCADIHALAQVVLRNIVVSILNLFPEFFAGRTFWSYVSRCGAMSFELIACFPEIKRRLLKS